VSGGDNETLTKRIFESIRDQIDPTVAAVSSMLMLLSVAVLLVTQAHQQRRGSVEP
jgi:putative spermidine/putrescine transport system permease protein